VARRVIVPAHDLDLSRLVLGDHGRVEVVGGRDMAPGGLEGLIFSERVPDVVVGRSQHVQRVAYATTPSIGCLRASIAEEVCPRNARCPAGR
jgi:hypothetical protein